jgi:histidinol-phosphatase (PHP family)
MVYRTDYHTHTTYSDGVSPPEDYISAAIRYGFSEIGFSDHLTLFRDQDVWNMDPLDLQSYIDHIENLKEKSDDIVIRTGLEVDYIEGKESETGTFLQSLPLDYIIGSVHFLGEKTVDMDPGIYQEKNIEHLFELYFNTVFAAIESGLFDILGHCDLIRIFGYRPEKDMKPYYHEMARLMKINNTVLEINTNGRNRPLADFYPDRRYLHLFMEKNVPVCVNSDAHRPSRIGQYFDEAYDLLRYTGFSEMATFRNRERYMIPF